MIYGANGYTGHLVAAEARRRGLKPVLAGRRAGPIRLDDAPAAANRDRGHGGRGELRWPIRSDQCSND
jgi:hypothetical protein